MSAMKIDRVLCCVSVFLIGNLGYASGSFRIFGGSSGIIEEHPWDISMQFKGLHVCGGAIISRSWVVTAAHCIHNKKMDSNYEIVVGTTRIDNYAGERFGIREVIEHFYYDSKTYDYDIAVIKLKNKLTYSNGVRPIKLPNEEYELPVGVPLTISGWGVTTDNPKDSSIILQTATIYSVSWTECYYLLSQINLFTHRMVCAGVPSGEQDTCQGDSGGALEANNTLIGLVSWGSGCGNAGYPGAYTNMAYFRSWIREYANV